VEEEEQAQKPWREDEGLMAFLRTLENAYHVPMSLVRAERPTEVDGTSVMWWTT
jgi:hypothetical protein